MKTALTIAGSDPSGGAGIQADIKTMTMNGVYAMSVITALTAQNTTGVTGIHEIPAAFLKSQLDAVFTDIFPDAVKIGMVSSSDVVMTIAERLRHYHAANIVVDPVMVATSGSRLMKTDAVLALTGHLFPIAALVTPNIPEAEVLSEQSITDKAGMEAAAEQICERYGCAVLLKGGHALNDADDLFCDGTTRRWFYGRRIDNPNTHGTGCTLSSAIAANLAKGCSLEESVGRAKEYLSGALAAMLDLGAGAGPMNHAFALAGRSGCVIRQAAWKDAAEIDRLFVEMLQTIYHRDEEPGVEVGYLDSFLNEEGKRVYVAETGGAVVAFASVAACCGEDGGEPFLYLDDFSVTAECRGRGIGTALLKAVEADAVSRGYTLVMLHVEAANTGARRLYGRFGYEEEGEAAFGERENASGERADRTIETAVSQQQADEGKGTGADRAKEQKDTRILLRKRL